jgi:hypothetical protein
MSAGMHTLERFDAAHMVWFQGQAAGFSTWNGSNLYNPGPWNFQNDSASTSEAWDMH